MARSVPDVALFLDTMAGYCHLDPMTFDAPRLSFSHAVAAPRRPHRVAFAATIGGSPVDQETENICRDSMRNFKNVGSTVEEISIDLEDLEDTFLALRSQEFVIDRELQLVRFRDLM